MEQRVERGVTQVWMNTEEGPELLYETLDEGDALDIIGDCESRDNEEGFEGSPYRVEEGPSVLARVPPRGGSGLSYSP